MTTIHGKRNPTATALLLLSLLAAAPFGRAAEFDVDAGRVVLRRIQFCRNCGSALLVTREPAGSLVRCPDCGDEQARLDNALLLTQTYQLCKRCLGPLDHEGRKAGDMARCGICGVPQTLSRDVFAVDPASSGLGYPPGFPPGKGEKILLLAGARPPGPPGPVPLESDPAAPPPPPAPTAIPRPPAWAVPPPLPEPSPPGPVAATPAAAPDPSPDVPGEAVRVPAVTADLFGGARRDGAAGRDAGTTMTAGAVAALVDGKPIRVEDVDRVAGPILERLGRQADPSGADREKALRREVLERLIDRELAVREAAAIGHKPDPNAVRARENELAQILAGGGVDVRREAERDVIMADMRRRYAERPGSASPQTVREYYNANKDKMLRPRLIALDQLVVYEERTGRGDSRNYRDIAAAIAGALEQGRRFDELREAHDEFLPAAGLPHAAPTPLPETAYAWRVLAAGGDLRKGAVFGPVFLPGLALFCKIADERPAGPAPFEEVEKRIRAALEEEATERNLGAWLRRLRQKARVEIFEE